MTRTNDELRIFIRKSVEHLKDVERNRGTRDPRAGLMTDAEEEGIYLCVPSEPYKAIAVCPYELRLHIEWIRSRKMLWDVKLGEEIVLSHQMPKLQRRLEQHRQQGYRTMDWGAVPERLTEWLIEAIKTTRGGSFQEFHAITGAISQQEWAALPKQGPKNVQQFAANMPGLLKERQLLGIAADATKAEATEAFRKLAAVQHPTKGGDPGKFSQIVKAF